MASNPRVRSAQRLIPPDSPYTPRATPLRSGVSARGVRSAPSVADESPAPTQLPITTKIAAHYALPPTIPSPYIATLDASLDAILAFAQTYGKKKGVQDVVDTLLRTVDAGTNWAGLLRGVYVGNSDGWEVLEELLFLVTRMLLPNQIAENRARMAALYERKKHLAIRMVLRYDMLREWKGESVASLPATEGNDKNGDTEMQTAEYTRPELRPNVISTLIVAPVSGWSTHGVRERMKHHVTELDEYLLLGDEKVRGWSDQTLLCMASQIILQWQWLRSNNVIFEEMEINGYEDLDGKADECEWINDDWKRKRGEKGKEED
jgi:hypothetical protein